MDKSRLSVFICGTYADLRAERSAIIDAITRMRFQYGSMELFGARPEAPIDVCLEEVRRSDVLVVVVGHRYGAYVPRTNTSFTETEYNEGYRLGKSCFVYIRDDNVRILPEDFERDADKLAKLTNFKEALLGRHTVYRFHDPASLALQVTVDLNRSMTGADSIESAMAILRRGVDAWNAWRRATLTETPEMRHVDLSKLQLEGFDFANMKLSCANFSRAALQGARFDSADLSGADLQHADLRFAQLDNADLSSTDLRHSDFSGARLVGAKLRGSLIIDATLRGANLTAAVWADTVIARSDLTDAKGLDFGIHEGESTVDFETLLKTRPLSRVFLEGAGLPEIAMRFAESLGAPQVQFYSCFISYSMKDQDFADRLHADLQNHGVRSWFAPHDVRGGMKIHEQINEAIRMYDRLLLILSEHSMNSEWVKMEIAYARQKELNDRRQVLFPISLVRFEKIREWKNFDADTGIDSAREVREYFIPDFSNWKDHDSYQVAFQRLVRDLKAEDHGPPAGR